MLYNHYAARDNMAVTGVNSPSPGVVLWIDIQINQDEEPSGHVWGAAAADRDVEA
jgi:hypothetical protein